jgi:hypothetical protein
VIKDTRSKLAMIILLVILFTGISVSITAAQSLSTRWSTPERLSSERGQASQGFMVSDQYGFVHAFWSEIGSDGQSSILYSRFDGEIWSLPNDVIATSPDATIIFMSPFVDDEGTIHLIWSESNVGPIFYSNAPAHKAGSAQEWSKRIIIDAPAFWGKLLVDSQGGMHILYSDFYGEDPGVYYIRSMNQGNSWSSPLWLDPDISDDHAPTIVSFDIDDQDSLHALWFYVDSTTTMGQWIRYSQSSDGGNTWSLPTTIDEADESDDELRLPYPEFKAGDNEIHVIWAGDYQTHREHRYSLNSGQTWSPTTRILGDLNGQALGGGVDFDSQGRLHYVTQIRYPQGIYHSYWDNDTWSIPSLIYFIAGGGDESFGDRIHAHNVRMVIRNGNQLVVTFTSSPTDPQMTLYEMHVTLDDVPEIEPLPTPTNTPMPLPTSTPQQPTINSSSNTFISNESDSPPIVSYQPASGVVWGLVVSLAILAGFVVFRVFQKR